MIIVIVFFFYFGFDWLLFNNFSVMLGRSRCFLGIYQYFGELKVSCSRTLHGGRGVRTLEPSLRSPTRDNCTTAPFFNFENAQNFFYILIRIQGQIHRRKKNNHNRMKKYYNVIILSLNGV